MLVHETRRELSWLLDTYSKGCGKTSPPISSIEESTRDARICSVLYPVLSLMRRQKTDDENMKKNGLHVAAARFGLDPRCHCRRLLPQVLSLFFKLDKGSRDLEQLHEVFRQVMTRLIERDKEVGFGAPTVAAVKKPRRQRMGTPGDRMGQALPTLWCGYVPKGIET